MPPQRGPTWLIPDWPAPAGVRALSTLRGGGVSGNPYASLNLGEHVGDGAKAVAENRRLLRAAAGLPAEPAWLTQVHGTCVHDLDLPSGPADSCDHADPASPVDATGAAFLGGGAMVTTPAAGAMDVSDAASRRVGGRPLTAAVADAAVTRQPGRVCAILTADCLPVLLTTESGDRVGAAHAGWRGLAGGVIEATVSALGASPSSLLAWLGPAIGPRHFEIGAEVREALLQGDRGAQAAFAPTPAGRFMADLYALARRRLARLGVERVFGGGECTHTDADRYFSHRRDGRTGRQATLIWLEPR